MHFKAFVVIHIVSFNAFTTFSVKTNALFLHLILSSILKRLSPEVSLRKKIQGVH